MPAQITTDENWLMIVKDNVIEKRDRRPDSPALLILGY